MVFVPLPDIASPDKMITAVYRYARQSSEGYCVQCNYFTIIVDISTTCSKKLKLSGIYSLFTHIHNNVSFQNNNTKSSCSRIQCKGLHIRQALFQHVLKMAKHFKMTLTFDSLIRGHGGFAFRQLHINWHALYSKPQSFCSLWTLAN